MTPGRGATNGEVILVALSVLVMRGPDAPVAAPGAADALERLSALGRTIILAGDVVAGRRLPADAEARERWVRAVIGRAVDVQVVPFDAPAWELHDVAGETIAQDAWKKVRSEQGATWLITDARADIRAARTAGLHVVLAGPRPSEEPLAAHADIAARDLADAARLLLAQDLFGQVPAA